MRMHWLIGLAVLAVLLVGCARAPPAAPSTTESAVSDFDKDLSELDAMNSELDASDMESLDKDFAALE